MRRNLRALDKGEGVRGDTGTLDDRFAVDQLRRLRAPSTVVALVSTKGGTAGTDVSPRRCPWWQRDPSQGRSWWKDAVIYQILPWSFLDTSGTGVGDLQGIIRRLDYVASLGVDAIWLTPFYESPMKDLGYDITNMLKIDPLFGVMEDFEILLSIAHDMGLKVLIDQVWNHTSKLHPWFVESGSRRSNQKADWYVWHDPNDDLIR